MGNGGGGTIIYGLDEEPGTSIAKKLTPLKDEAFVGKIEDMVRDGVHPPLIWSHKNYKADGQFVVSIDIEPSKVGPYRVDAYGEGRYYTRSHQSTAPTTESQVRDAYALATRASESRNQLWTRHSLPMTPAVGHPWLVISGLPFEPLRELFEGREIELSSFVNPAPLSSYPFPPGLRQALGSLRHWADGLTGEGMIDSALGTAVRIHRDGALGIAVLQPDFLKLDSLAREVNAYLIYASWFWQRFQLPRPVELEIGLVGLQSTTIGSRLAGSSQIQVVQPAGVFVDGISISQEFLPWELTRAHERHRLIRRFIDRLTLAYGYPFSNELFEYGWLFDARGQKTKFALHRGMITDPTQGNGIRVAQIDTQGWIPGASSEYRAFAKDGAIIDASGNIVAVTEMAVSPACPIGFLPPASALPNEMPPQYPNEPVESSHANSIPDPSARWSEQSLDHVIE